MMKRESQTKTDTKGRQLWLGIHWLDTFPFGIALCFAGLLKRYYSSATASDLDWILGPTAHIVTQLSGYGFEHEAGAGYLNRELSLLIAPACSGINFLIISFLLLVTGFTRQVKRVPAKFTWLILSVAVAYLATLLVNSLRILCTIAMRNGFTLEGVSYEELHRVEGVVLYLGSLWLLYSVTRKLFAVSPSTWRSALPLGMYLAITILVPLLNGGFQRAEFFEHAAVVLTTSLLLYATVRFLGWALKQCTAARRVEQARSS